MGLSFLELVSLVVLCERETKRKNHHFGGVPQKRTDPMAASLVLSIFARLLLLPFLVPLPGILWLLFEKSGFCCTHACKIHFPASKNDALNFKCPSFRLKFLHQHLVQYRVCYCGWTKSCIAFLPRETMVCWYLQGIESFQGFLGGAGFRPSTVARASTSWIEDGRSKIILQLFPIFEFQ